MEAKQNENDFWLDGCPMVRCRRCTAADVPALCDWCDVYLRPDYHFPRKQMLDVCSRPASDVFAIEVAAEMAGFICLYNGSTLHNLYLAPDFRRMGIGAAILHHFRPTTVRAKSNMQAGDPTPFYEKNGYDVISRDPKRPHIATMARRDASTAICTTEQLSAEEIESAAEDSVGVGDSASDACVPGPHTKRPPIRRRLTDAEAAAKFRERARKNALRAKTRRAMRTSAAENAPNGGCPPERPYRVSE